MDSKLLRRFYSQYLRNGLSDAMFGSGRLSTLTRQRLLSSPPPFVGEPWNYGQSEVVELMDPIHVGGLPKEIRRKVGTWRIDAPFVVQFEDIQLVGPDALPIAPDGSYVLEGVEGSTERATDAIVLSLLNRVIPRRRTTDSGYELAVSLAGPWSDEFFHWFVDYLPRLLAIEEYIKQSSIEPVYLVPSKRPNWLSRSLELLKITDGRIISWDKKRAKVDHLLLPSLWRHTESTAPPEGYIHSPRGIREVGNHLRQRVQKDEVRDEIGDRLYVSRSGATTRNVLNELELQPILNDYGFDIVYPEQWTLDEQIATFAEADVVAGPHGAGLTNAMYASNPTVMELFGRNTNPCYFGLFAGNDWDYGLVNGDDLGSNIRIKPANFRKLCEMMLD